MAYTFKHGDRPLDGYTIQRAVGRGGFGEVYYAISDGGREVALKYLRDNPQVELRGVSNCINLKSPFLVSIFDVKKTHDGDYIIIMEYCSGPSLRDLLIAEPNGFPPEKAAFFVREIAKGLSYLHDRGIVHRDLKPGNIFYDDGYVKIGDYGLSKFISVSRHSAQTASVGTVHYMAPEIGSGDYSRGVDIYALGVMTYEMLRGKVPFEGSSMGEILMKHLTSQPEVDNLPAPFGKIIRTALQKDPRERFQTVNEMVDELLGVEAIQKSLAGFSTQSLGGAVAHGAERPADHSPMPSPNPPPVNFAGPRGIPVPGAPLPKRVGKRFERVSRKIDAKLARMGGRPVPPPALQQGIGGAMRTMGHAIAHANPDRWKRVVLSVILAVGLAVALGIICGVNISDEAGVAAGLLIPAMAGAVAVSRKAVPWFGATYGPKWALFMIRAGCSAPLLAVGAAPVLGSRHSEEGFGMWIGLLAVCVFANWSRTFERATSGEVGIGSAIWTGFGAMIATAIPLGMMGVEPPPYMFVAAGVAAAVSFVIQASTWWAGSGGWQPQSPGAGGAGAAGSTPPFAQPVSPTAASAGDANHVTPSDGQAQTGMEARDPRVRWVTTRAIWSLLAFVMMGGTIVLFLITLILDGLRYDDRTGTILGCIACASGMIFALRKTTLVKREGFWRETLRPFLMSAALFGIGATTTAISRHWFEFPTDERGGLITGLVFSSLFFLVLLFARGRRRRHVDFLKGAQPANTQDEDGRQPGTPGTKDESPEPPLEPAEEAR